MLVIKNRNMGADKCCFFLTQEEIVTIADMLCLPNEYIHLRYYWGVIDLKMICSCSEANICSEATV